MGQMRPWKSECIIDILYRAGQSLSPDVEMEELYKALANVRLDRRSPPAARPDRKGSLSKAPVRPRSASHPVRLPKFTSTPPNVSGTSSGVAVPAKNPQNPSMLNDPDPDPQAGEERSMEDSIPGNDPSHDARPVRPSMVPWAGLEDSDSDDDSKRQKRRRFSPDKYSQSPVTFVYQAPKLN